MHETRARRAGFGLLGLLLVVLAINGSTSVRDCRLLRPAGEGDVAPDVVLAKITSEGRLADGVSLLDLRGQVVVVDFWATWCGPCQDSMPVLEDIAHTYGERGVVVLSVNTEGPEKAGPARQMVNRLSPSVLLVSDAGQAADLFRVTTIPHVLVVDRKGVIRFVHRGFSGASDLRLDLEAAIDPLL